MHLFKKHISRRTVLKGVGATIALPLLDAMNPAATAWAQTPAGSTPKRFAFIGFPHGAIMDKWSPAQTGANFEMSPILQPLEPFKQHLTIVSGLRNKPGESPEPHGYIEMTWLSCVKPAEHGVAGPDSGVSADQFAARHIGQETRVPSLELTTALGGARLAWRTPTQSLPQEGNPRAVFQKLFGQGDTDAERAAILQETGSILDRVKGQAARLQASLGVNDRVVVSDYLDSVREIERRVQMASKADMSRLEIPDAPVGTPNDLTEHFKLMFDLMALAFQADITRVITFSMDREASMRTYTNLGIAEGFHPLSHHGNNADKTDQAGADSALPHRGVRQVHRAAVEGAGGGRHGARSLDDSLRQQHEQQRQAQQRSAAVGDPRSRARTHQGRPAREVSAGLALCRSAGDAVRSEQHPGGEDRRQRRHPVGDLRCAP